MGNRYYIPDYYNNIFIENISNTELHYTSFYITKDFFFSKIEKDNDLIYIFETPGLVKEQLSVKYDYTEKKLTVKCSKIETDENDILFKYKNQEKQTTIIIKEKPEKVFANFENGLLIVRLVNVYNKQNIMIDG